ncbi:uncharacterized protein Bfra_003929 [Botrytis fragariae]|uniref:Uncharacterized protein n=1 Tax=Botrytis fragariae TaxID=1964551 RepID=A0A8H6EKQ8_9HELO|nr:uncharacterized protein Bfra_003929 [Botrytis fragariae]KAF5875475.1 hypothetical protein Bfra_003929 [Botrytis fragariae]
MLTLEAFENWAIGEKDHKGEIITEQRKNAAHKDSIEKHPKDPILITRKMVMGLFRMTPIEFEKKYFPVIYAARTQVQRLENAPKSTIDKSQIIRYNPTSPPPSYAYKLPDTPPATEPSFTAELEAAPVKAKSVLLPPPTKSVTKISHITRLIYVLGGFRDETKFDGELREYKEVCLKTKGDLAYALYLRGRFSEEEYTKFCAEYREGDIPK